MEKMLADALLRRKELQDKVAQLRTIKEADVFEVIMERRKISDTVDDIRAKVPKLEARQVTAEYDFYARQLRLIDAAIQRTNWTTEVATDPSVWGDFKIIP